MSAQRLFLLAFCLAAAQHTSAAQQPETSHLAFVTEYVRELAAVEGLRASGEQELKQDPKAIVSNVIHTSTLFQLELRSQIAMLKSMRLDPPHDYLIEGIAGFYEQKIELWQRMADIGSAFMGGPKPGVDYDKLAAEMPKIRAELEYIDQSLFKTTPGVFATLIDLREDSKHHASHLVITKAERSALLADLNTQFGTKLTQKNPNYTVASAQILRDALLKGFKCSDEPWE